MKSAIGNTFLMNFIIIFTVIFIGLFITSLSYTKALRIKNRITDIIEENNGYNNKEVAAEIEAYLKDAGYRISNGKNSTCSYKGDTSKVVYPATTTNVYDYCIFKFENSKGTYYGVKTYMYLDVPVIGDLIKIGVYGETKNLGILG